MFAAVWNAFLPHFHRCWHPNGCLLQSIYQILIETRFGGEICEYLGARFWEGLAAEAGSWNMQIQQTLTQTQSHPAPPAGVEANLQAAASAAEFFGISWTHVVMDRLVAIVQAYSCREALAGQNFKRPWPALRNNVVPLYKDSTDRGMLRGGWLTAQKVEFPWAAFRTKSAALSRR